MDPACAVRSPTMSVSRSSARARLVPLRRLCHPGRVPSNVRRGLRRLPSCSAITARSIARRLCPVVPSQARAAFEENREDVERLMEIHGDLAGDAPGRKRGVEVLNKSAIVLMCAVWEAYCEDLAAEAVEHLVVHAEAATALPKALLKTIAAELESDKNDLAIWGLAGDGWKTILRSRLADITKRRTGPSIPPSPATSTRCLRKR